MIICITRATPAKDPIFHRKDIDVGIGVVIRASLIILSIGFFSLFLKFFIFGWF